MELTDAKLIRGLWADDGTEGERAKMQWLCGDFIENGRRHYIGCFDMTVIGPEKNRPNGIFYVRKGTLPALHDFQPNAHKNYEDRAFAQIIVHEWDKLGNGDTIHISEEVEEKILEWAGEIWKSKSDENPDFRYKIKKQWKWEKK